MFPSPFPKQEFERSLELQPLLNELMHKVAHDKKFLTETLKHTIKVDEFTRKLFEIYETVQNEGVSQVTKAILKGLGAYWLGYYCLSSNSEI